MRFSDYTFIKAIINDDLEYEYFAEVDVTTGILWWKKTKRRMVHSFPGRKWHFVDNGEYIFNQRYLGEDKRELITRMLNTQVSLSKPAVVNKSNPYGY